MTLTPEQRAILANAEVDVDGWVAHALQELGEWAVFDKIEANRAAYVAAQAKSDYSTAADRQAARATADTAKLAAAKRDPVQQLLGELRAEPAKIEKLRTLIA